ncbi:hypothetical protein Tco_1297812 [Tanacetum coccineum]
MPLALKTQNDSFVFVHELKQEMHVDLKYVESLEKEIDELKSDKAEFSNMYDMLLKECVSNDVMCSYLHSLSALDTHTELQCLYLHKVKECDCLAQKLLKQTKSVICKEKASNVFLKEHEQYFEIQDLKAKLQDKDIAICELKKLIEKCKGKSMETKFDKSSMVRQPNAQRIPKPSVLGLNHRTNVSRPQLKSNKMKEKVMPNTSQVKFKKTEVEDHHKISSISNQSKSVTACNGSLKSRTLNVNAICATCGKCMFNSNHDACISKYLNDVNARTKKPKVVPISNRKPKSQANKSIATPRKKTVASESTVQNSKSYYRMMYEKTSNTWKWWIEQQCPLGYKWVPKKKMKWVPKVRNDHITGNLPLLYNFVEKYLGTVRFGNDQFAPILGYGDLVQGNIMINRVYYVENLFSVGQFYDADLKVAFRKSTCFVRDLQGNDLLTGNRGSDLYTISLQETTSSTPICLMAKASSTQAWL